MRNDLFQSLNSTMKYKKRKLYFLFYRSTLFVSIPFTLAFSVLLHMKSLDKSKIGFINGFLYLYPIIGTGSDLVYKELVRKKEYYFYYNHQCNKPELWAFSIGVSFLISFCLYHLINLWK